MIKRILLDWIIACVSLAACVLTVFYMRGQIWLIAVTGCLTLLFFILGLTGLKKSFVVKNKTETRAAPGARQLVLVNEDGGELGRWDLYGRTSLVIGRDAGENQVDVNLADATYAGFIEIEHAAMNFANGCWYIEDLNSANGVRVQKHGDRRQYRLAAGKPCRIDAGDAIYIAQTKLLMS